MNESSILQTYAAYSFNDEIRMKSSSGAIFSMLADWIFKKAGIVYGVALTENCKTAVFIRATDVRGIDKIRGSKYFQAHVGNTYKEVKQDLDKGKCVLFTGTGCQVNGLKLFLGKEYENLICVDVICHGVPSPELWRVYVAYRESEIGGKLLSINFRCKDYSWTDFGMKEVDDYQKQIYISKDKDPFMMMFLRDYCLRPSCYECAARKVRYSDITIADFWGIDEVAPDMNDGKGTSLVIVRTDKGEKCFEQIKNSIKSRMVPYEAGIKHNSAEYKSPVRPLQRDRFFEDMRKLSFSDMKRKYALQESVSIKRSIKQVIKIIWKTPIKKFFGGGTTQ